MPPDQVLDIAEREGATPFDVSDVELGHHDGKCSFEAIVLKYAIADPAIALLERHEIVTIPSASVLAMMRHETGERSAAARTLAIVADPVFDAGDGAPRG